MKKLLSGSLLVVLLLATPSLAQFDPPPSVGVYFDPAGTQITGTFVGGFDEPIMAYVIVFWEASIGGASYGLSIDPRLTLLSATYQTGVQIGHPLDGCGVEVGLTSPGFGFMGNPVLISTLILVTDEPIASGLICTTPHCGYGSVMVADSMANLFVACSHCSFIDVPVQAETTSWGSVKSLYR